MENNKRIGFGKKGWLLMAVCFLGIVMYQTFTNYPLNILADFYGGAQKVAMLMSIGTFVGIVLQMVLSTFIRKLKSIKKYTVLVGIVSVIAAIGVTCIPYRMLTLWMVAYLVVNITATMYALFFLSIFVGQWFPRRKGTVMGIVTIAYPVVNGVIGFFASTVMAPLAQGGEPAILKGFFPFLLLSVLGYVLFVVFIKDYPEQCGAFRDNDKTFTIEDATKMMEEELENKKSSVWTPGNTFRSRDFWFASITCGIILMGSVGTMTQSNAIISCFPTLNFAVVMMIIAVFGVLGSWLMGMFDTRVGTKKAMMLATCFMMLAGLMGVIATMSGKGLFCIISLMLVAVYMGSSSNFMVSVTVQYWRREDFAGIFACLNPISNIFTALAPSVIAILISSYWRATAVFAFLLVIGCIGFFLMVAFRATNIKKVDDKYRMAAGKVLDNELAERK